MQWFSVVVLFHFLRTILFPIHFALEVLLVFKITLFSETESERERQIGDGGRLIPCLTFVIYYRDIALKKMLFRSCSVTAAL